MDYFESYKRARSADLHAREYFRNLNSARSLLKHQGLFPDAKQWSRVGETVFQHINKWCWDDLTVFFSTLMSQRCSWTPTSSAFTTKQSRLLLKEITKLHSKNSHTRYPLCLRRMLRYVDSRLRHARPEDAIRVVGFGIHGNDFLALQQFLPRVRRYSSEANILQWKQSAFGHPGNWREDSAEFCLRTFVDVAVKLQGAQWIPGPLSRNILYDQQIEALKDGVEFWRYVPEGDPSKPWESALFGKTNRETKQLLKRGEKLKTMVSRASAVGSASVFFGGTAKDERVLSVMLVDTLESWNVLAADVKVTCVPKDTESVKQYFAWLPEIEWEPE